MGAWWLFLQWFQDIVKGFDAGKRFCLSMEFLKISASNSKVYWSFDLGEDNSFLKKANKRPHEPQTEGPLSIARNGCRALKWCGPF